MIIGFVLVSAILTRLGNSVIIRKITCLIVKRIRLACNGVSIHFGFQDIDFVIFCYVRIKGQFRKPDAVLQNKFCAGWRIVLHLKRLDRHVTPVGHIAVVDPVLAHQNLTAAAGAIGYRGVVVTIFVPDRFVFRNTITCSYLLQQDVLVCPAVLVVLGQITDYGIPINDLFTLVRYNTSVNLNFRISWFLYQSNCFPIPFKRKVRLCILVQICQGLTAGYLVQIDRDLFGLVTFYIRRLPNLCDLIIQIVRHGVCNFGVSVLLHYHFGFKGRFAQGKRGSSCFSLLVISKFG